MQKQRRGSQEIIVQPWGRMLVPPQGIYITISLSSSAELRPPTQVEDGNFRLKTKFLEYSPVTLPPTNQKKVTHPATLTPNFAYKNFSSQTIQEFGVFEHEPPVLLACPCNKPFSAPNSAVSVYLTSLFVRHMNFCSVTMSVRLQLSEGLAGAGGGLLPKSLMLLLAKVLSPHWVLAGTTVPHQVGFSVGVLKTPQDMADSFSQGQ